MNVEIPPELLEMIRLQAPEKCFLANKTSIKVKWGERQFLIARCPHLADINLIVALWNFAHEISQRQLNDE